MEIRGQSSSPKPLLTPHFPEPPFAHMQSDFFKEIVFEVDSRCGFCKSFRNLLFSWVLQTPIGTSQEGEPCWRASCWRSAQEVTAHNISRWLWESWKALSLHVTHTMWGRAKFMKDSFVSHFKMSISLLFSLAKRIKPQIRLGSQKCELVMDFFSRGIRSR